MIKLISWEEYLKNKEKNSIASWRNRQHALLEFRIKYGWETPPDILEAVNTLVKKKLPAQI